MNAQTRVKERAEEQANAMSAEQQAAIRMLANDLHRLNHSIMKAVDAGVSVVLGTDGYGIYSGDSKSALRGALLSGLSVDDVARVVVWLDAEPAVPGAFDAELVHVPPADAGLRLAAGRNAGAAAAMALANGLGSPKDSMIAFGRRSST